MKDLVNDHDSLTVVTARPEQVEFAQPLSHELTPSVNI